MSLTLVIPVWNDQGGLTPLLKQAQSLRIFDEIVVVDDGSVPLIEVPELGALKVTLLRHDQPHGPGAARNRGLERVTSKHVLFFDSDDELTPALADLWHDLKGQHFDFCIFCHADSGLIELGQWGISGYDAALWREAGMGAQALGPLSERGRVALAQTANFPWNKIWRTDMLREHDIRYSQTMVHEDIEPHWRGFAEAKTILASDRVAAIHYVSSTGNRLTNRCGPERLELFTPLARVRDSLQNRKVPQAQLFTGFLIFTADLFEWIIGNLDASLCEDFTARRIAFWRQTVSGKKFETLADTNPLLARKLCLQMMPAPQESA